MSAAQAANLSWRNSAGGSFQTASNWFGAMGVPDGNDYAFFGLSSGPFGLPDYTVSFSATATNLGLVISDDRVIFDLNTNGYFATEFDAVTIGTTGSAGLTVREGIFAVPFQSEFAVGAAANRTGSLTVTTGGLIFGDPSLEIGVVGTGILTILNGGVVGSNRTHIGFLENTTGTATITGAGSRLTAIEMFVGNAGTGTLNINTGGAAEIDGDTYIGNFADSIGTINVSGTSSVLDTSGRLIVGFAAQGTPGVVAGGTLNITADGTVKSGSGTVGDDADSTGAVNVDGTGSKWNNSGRLTVGSFGSGTLNISGGSLVTSTSGHIAADTDITGTVNVAGPNSRWINSGRLDVGKGQAALNITGGARVENTEGLINASDDAVTSTVKVDGANSQWINSGALTVAGFGKATLDVTAGGSVSSAGGIIGRDSIADGTVTVTNAQWLNSGELAVGHFGNGTLNISGDSLVTSTSGHIAADTDIAGTVNIFDPNSRWINSGNLSIGKGHAALNVTRGARVENADGVINASDVTATSTVKVDGDNSQWINSGSLTVAGFGKATLDVTSGGSVSSAGGVIGRESNADGKVTVDGDESEWDNSSLELIVAQFGTGTLDITDGGQVESTGGIIGDDDDSIGKVTVNGDNSIWLSFGSLVVGRSGHGELNITAGATVLSNTAQLGRDSSFSTGTVTVAGAGSVLILGGRLGIGVSPNLTVDKGRGTLRIQHGGTVSVAQDTVLGGADDALFLEGGTLSTSEIAFRGGGSFDWTSGTLHVGVYNGGIFVPNGGVLAPGNSAGTTLVLGTYVQGFDGTLEIEIGGRAAGTQYDVLTVSSDAFIGGYLELAMLNGFVPSASDTFTILQANSITGTFVNVAGGQRLATRDGTGSFIVNYGSSLIVLSSFLAALPGDYNLDGFVNAADYTVWRDHLGQSFTLTNENPAAATPGVVDAEDYAFWKSRFGDSLGSGSGAAATATVPEPTTLVLLMLVTTGWCVRRGRAAQKVPATHQHVTLVNKPPIFDITPRTTADRQVLQTGPTLRGSLTPRRSRTASSFLEQACRPPRRRS